MSYPEKDAKYRHKPSFVEDARAQEGPAAKSDNTQMTSHIDNQMKQAGDALPHRMHGNDEVTTKFPNDGSEKRAEDFSK